MRAKPPDTVFEYPECEMGEPGGGGQGGKKEGAGAPVALQHAIKESHPSPNETRRGEERKEGDRKEEGGKSTGKEKQSQKPPLIRPPVEPPSNLV